MSEQQHTTGTPASESMLGGYATVGKGGFRFGSGIGVFLGLAAYIPLDELAGVHADACRGVQLCGPVRELPVRQHRDNDRDHAKCDE